MVGVAVGTVWCLEGVGPYASQCAQQENADEDKPKGVRELKKLKKQQRVGDAAPEEGMDFL